VEMCAWTVSVPSEIGLPTSVVCVARVIELVVSDVECYIAMLLGFLHPKHLCRINKCSGAFAESETLLAPQ
jgi:hypothetical protein